MADGLLGNVMVTGQSAMCRSLTQILSDEPACLGARAGGGVGEGGRSVGAAEGVEEDNLEHKYFLLTL